MIDWFFFQISFKQSFYLLINQYIVIIIIINTFAQWLVFWREHYDISNSGKKATVATVLLVNLAYVSSIIKMIKLVFWALIDTLALHLITGSQWNEWVGWSGVRVDDCSGFIIHAQKLTNTVHVALYSHNGRSGPVMLNGKTHSKYTIHVLNIKKRVLNIKIAF